MHKRKPLAAAPPERLQTFEVKDWEKPGDTGEWQARGRWHEAREAWAAEHPGNLALGTKLDRIRDLMPQSYLNRRR
jgi:hypothetical protein